MPKLPEEMDNPFAEERTEGEVAQTLEMRAEAERLKEQPTMVEVHVKESKVESAPEETEAPEETTEEVAEETKE